MSATWLETDSNTNINIAAATAVGAYTATGDKFIMAQLLADQVAGNGDYVYYVTLQVGGAGSSYVIGPKTTQAAASGETAIGAQSGYVTVRNGDVVTVYIDGLAGDTTTPDVIVRWFELAAATSAEIAALPTDADVQAAAAAALTAYDAATGAEIAALPDSILDDEEVSVGVTVRQGIAAAGAAGDPLTNPASGYVAPQIGFYMQKLANDQVQIISVFDPVSMSLSFRYGDDYATTESRSQTFTTTLNLTGAAVSWRVKASTGVKTVACTIANSTTYVLAVTAEHLEAIGVGVWPYDLEITLVNTNVVTEITGLVVISADVR